MKKRLVLFVLMLAVCTLALALSIGAAQIKHETNEYGEVSILDNIGVTTTYGDTESRVVLKNGDGTYSTYPAYYIYNGSSGSNMRLSFDKIKEATGDTTYSNKSVIRIEVFENSRLNWTFDGCSNLIDVYLPDTVYFHYASFKGCSSLTSIEVPSAATQIPTDCFAGCTSLASIELPETVRTLGERCFEDCDSLLEIKIPMAVTTIPQNIRRNGTSGATLIVSNSVTSLQNAYSLKNCGFTSIIFTGNESSTFVSEVQRLASEFIPKITYANHCEYYYDNNHDYTLDGSYENDCYGYCARCSSGVVKENPNHACENVITYPNGYIAKGQNHIACTNEGCKYELTEETDELIYFAGIATDKNNTSICVGYSVNKDALDAYIDNGNTFRYGVLAYIPASADDNKPLDENGMPVNADGTIFAELDTSYGGFELVIKGFAAEHYTTELAMCAYTYDGNAVNYINVGFVNGQKPTVTQDSVATTVSVKTVSEYVPPKQNTEE